MTTYTNDAAGNTRADGTRTNTWDSENRLAQCVTGSGASQTTSTFTYGSDGLRRKMLVQVGNNAATAQFTETTYVIEGTNVVQELVRAIACTKCNWMEIARASMTILDGDPRHIRLVDEK